MMYFLTCNCEMLTNEIWIPGNWMTDQKSKNKDKSKERV